MTKAVLFQIIQFSISTLFKGKYGFNCQKHFYLMLLSVNQTIQFSISMPLVLFKPYIGPYQVLPGRARVDLGAMAMKGSFVFPQSPSIYWNLIIRLFSVINRTLIGEGVLPLCRGAVSVFYSPSRLVQIDNRFICLNAYKIFMGIFNVWILNCY